MAHALTLTPVSTFQLVLIFFLRFFFFNTFFTWKEGAYVSACVGKRSGTACRTRFSSGLPELNS